MNIERRNSEEPGRELKRHAESPRLNDQSHQTQQRLPFFLSFTIHFLSPKGYVYTSPSYVVDSNQNAQLPSHKNNHFHTPAGKRELLTDQAKLPHIANLRLRESHTIADRTHQRLVRGSRMWLLTRYPRTGWICRDLLTSGRFLHGCRKHKGRTSLQASKQDDENPS